MKSQKEKFDSPARNRGTGAPDSKEFQSTKMHIQTTRGSICDQKGVARVPEDLRFKIQGMLEKNALRHGRGLGQLAHATSIAAQKPKK